MKRLRFFRILLPALLIALGTLLVYELQPQRPVHTASPQTERETVDEPRAEGAQIRELKGGQPSLAGKVDVVRELAEGRLRFEGISGLQIEREGREPLIVEYADAADVEGPAGGRLMRIEGKVAVRDPEHGLEIELPRLEVDEPAGEARSDGDIRFWDLVARGQARALVYGLRGQPGTLTRPLIEDTTGASVSAERGELLDGIRDIVLVGDVRARRGGQALDAGRLRVVRGEERLERIEAVDRVHGVWEVPGLPTTEVRAGRLELEWTRRGEVGVIRLREDAVVRRGEESIAAPRIDALRRADGQAGWDVRASETVYVQGRFDSGPGLLRAERLHALLDGLGVLQTAEARGRVSYDAGSTRAEADVATLSQGESGEIRLQGDARRKARLARGTIRLAAEDILTDARGERLSGTGRVEATLLPGEGGKAPRTPGVFDADEAVHFVSSTLVSTRGGMHLVFEGSARGWQGERNLAGERIAIDQQSRTVDAEGGVNTRIPRDSASVVSEDDYVQIGAERLEYAEKENRATYTGEVSVRLAEGWLEAERVEVDVDPDTQRIRQARASGAVRLEFLRTAERELTTPFRGEADRAVYSPGEKTVWLYGEKSPAVARRIGSGGGTTTGRVLRYRLDLGTLEVDSGEQGPARIRTSPR